MRDEVKKALDVINDLDIEDMKIMQWHINALLGDDHLNKIIEAME